MLIVALMAIILPLVLVVGLKQPAKIGMSISAVIVSALAWLVWKTQPLVIAASAMQGIHRAMTIGLILFGAITLLKTLESTKALARIKLGLHSISSDMRVLTVLVAFGFVSLLEGISGFGTPAIVAAPLLMVLGFRPLAAASLALLGDTVACSFGAVGTPLIIGLENVPIYSTNLISLVGARVTVYDLVIGTLLPLGLTAVLIFSFGGQTRHQKWLALREIAPWAIFIGLVYSVSAFMAVRLFGPEFTSIIAGAAALAVATITAHQGWLIPKTTWRHHAGQDTTEQTTDSQAHSIPLWQAWSPYLIVIVILLLTRVSPIVKQWLQSAADGGWYDILGVSGISSSWPIFYSPGVVLLVGAISASLIISRSLRPLGNAAKQSVATTSMALLALVPTLIMVQVFINSGTGQTELVSMPAYIGIALSELFGRAWIAVAPLLGAIGAFIAGSSTISTLTMSPVQYSIASNTGLPFIDILALQMLGAAAGNTIAIHNVVAASVVVGLVHRESLIIRKLIIPTIAYLVLAAIVGSTILLMGL